jgi:hypothetical protein
MRHVAAGLGVGALLVVAGCNTFGFLRPEQQTRVGGPLSEPPSKEALVIYLNENSQRVQTLRCNDLDLGCTMGLQVANLRGQMLCQRPRNFRMSAGLSFVGKTEVDIGSNNEEFWYWLRRGDNYQFHCSYKDLSEGKVRRLPFPFQPEWVIEALGLGTYGPPDRYEYDTTDSQTLRLVERTTSPQGTPVRKVIVFRRSKVPLPGAQVTDYLLLDDASNKEICAAHIAQVQIDRNTGAIVPLRVEMRWPEMKLRMTMRFDGVAVNPNPPIDPTVAFLRRPLSGVPGFDLATMRPDATLQRAQGFTH